ncbi:hypothetical protein D3C71_2212660 [compost metagenome]
MNILINIEEAGMNFRELMFRKLRVFSNNSQRLYVRPIGEFANASTKILVCDECSRFKHLSLQGVRLI